MHERRARLQPGADWLRAERERRSWSQRELAERITEAGFAVKQDRISVYENAQDEPPAGFARGLASALGLPQRHVWRGLHLPLPAEFETEEAENDYYERRYGHGLYQRVEELTGEKTTKPGASERDTGIRQKKITREGEGREKPSRRRASGT
jgi:transcriptional regulator with XRE-family HTH domain